MHRSLIVVAIISLLAPLSAAAGVEPFGPADLAGWYQAQTGYRPNAEYFGAYALAPVGEQLYIGFGTARPGEANGALLARLRGDQLTAVGMMLEQGVIEIQPVDGVLWLPGPDPMQDWSLGNVYRYAGSLTQLRTLPMVIHTWGLDAQPGRLIAAVGRHLGDNATWAGGLYTSLDDGATWTLDADPALGAYRTYDVRQGRRGLVAVAADGYTNDCPVVIQPTGGSWQRTGQSVVCRARLAAVHGRVVAMAAGGRGLVEPLTGRAWAFSGWTAQPWAYNWLATDGHAAYVLGRDNQVRRSVDLTTWTVVAQFTRPLLSIAYWPGPGVIVAERGVGGRLWRLTDAID